MLSFNVKKRVQENRVIIAKSNIIDAVRFIGCFHLIIYSEAGGRGCQPDGGGAPQQFVSTPGLRYLGLRPAI